MHLPRSLPSASPPTSSQQYKHNNEPQKSFHTRACRDGTLKKQAKLDGMTPQHFHTILHLVPSKLPTIHTTYT